MNLKKEYLHNFCYQKYFFIYYNENLFLTNVYIYTKMQLQITIYLITR